VSELAAEKADYGNWVSAKLVYIPGVITLLFLGFSIVLPILVIGAVIFFLPFVYFAYARHRFSSKGGNIQTKVQDLLLDRITGWDGTGAPEKFLIVRALYFGLITLFNKVHCSIFRADEPVQVCGFEFDDPTFHIPLRITSDRDDRSYRHNECASHVL